MADPFSVMNGSVICVVNHSLTQAIKKEHVASEREPILQAADAVAGAYFQKYEHQNDEYVRIIEEKVGSFKYLWRK
jgi:hypothetical protein